MTNERNKALLAKKGKTTSRPKPSVHCHPKQCKSAKSTLRDVRFSGGQIAGAMRISPQITDQQLFAIKLWLRKLPEPLSSSLPLINITVVESITLTNHGVFINESVATTAGPIPENIHAVSFISDRYIILSRSLFRHRIEVGRIFYHELCHFVWPRLGNLRRGRFEQLLRQELRDGTRGELGYSSENRKAELRGRTKAGKSPNANRRLREYFCESFCDTGAYVLLGAERRRNHSEFTLSESARKRRCDLWASVVLDKKRSARPDHLTLK